MRVVLDTNILARTAKGGNGPAAELLRLVTYAPHLLIVSPFLLSELLRVLRYPRMRPMHGLDDNGIDAYVRQVQTASLVVTLPAATPAGVVSPDPNDDPIIATAVAGRAEVICTRDRHFSHPDVRSYCGRHGVDIQSDVELLARLRGC